MFEIKYNKKHNVNMIKSNFFIKIFSYFALKFEKYKKNII